MCWFLFECLAADPAHTHTHAGRPFLSSCRCGRVPNDIFYTLFFGFSFVPLDKPKARGEPQSKRNETSFIHLNSTHPSLTSPQLTQLNTSLNCLSLCLCLSLSHWLSLCLCAKPASASVSALPLPPTLPCQLVPFGSCCCCCWAQFSVFVWQVHQIIDRWLCTGNPACPQSLTPLALHNSYALLEFYDIFCTFRRGRATH